MGIVLVRRAAAVSSGTADGDTIVRTGPAATKPSVEWLGGLDGVVDSMSSGDRFDQLGRTGWALETPSTSRWPTCSVEQAWSRGKSIIHDTRGGSEYKQSLYFDTGASGYGCMYTSHDIYFDHDTLTSGYMQWKMMRWTRMQTVVDGDGSYIANRPNSVGFLNTFNSAGIDTKWFDAGSPYEDLPTDTGWYRYETWTRLNSTPGTTDGYFRVKVTRRTDGVVVTDNAYTDIRQNGASDSGNYRYHCLQNYFGNADVGDGGNAHGRAWWDDHYVSWTTAKTGENVRAELCDSSTYSNGIICEVVSIVGTDWSVKLNGAGTGKYLALFGTNETPTMVAV